MKNKLKTSNQLAKHLNIERSLGKIIVGTSGSFDLLNIKHIDILTEYRKRGDILVVFLNSDASVKSYKGKNRPVVSEKDRAATLSALEAVDHVVMFDECTPLEIIKKIKPDIYCNYGGDWGDNFIEKDLILSYGGKIYLSKIPKREKTSDVLRKVRQLKHDDMKAFYFDINTIMIDNDDKIKFTKDTTKVLKYASSKGYTLVCNFKNTDAKKIKEIVKHLKDKKIELLDIRKTKEGDIATGRSYVFSTDLSDIKIGKMQNSKTVFLGKAPKNTSSYEYPNYQIENLTKIINILD